MISLESRDRDLPQGLQIGVLDDRNLSLLVKFRRETNRLDYKSTFCISNKKTCYEFGKDTCAFSNTSGGYIVIGVEPKTYKAIGITDQIEKDLDPTIISQTLSRFVSPSINLHTYIGSFKKKE